MSEDAIKNIQFKTTAVNENLNNTAKEKSELKKNDLDNTSVFLAKPEPNPKTEAPKTGESEKIEQIKKEYENKLAKEVEKIKKDYETKKAKEIEEAIKAYEAKKTEESKKAAEAAKTPQQKNRENFKKEYDKVTDEQMQKFYNELRNALLDEKAEKYLKDKIHSPQGVALLVKTLQNNSYIEGLRVAAYKGINDANGIVQIALELVRAMEYVDTDERLFHISSGSYPMNRLEHKDYKPRVSSAIEFQIKYETYKTRGQGALYRTFYAGEDFVDEDIFEPVINDMLNAIMKKVNETNIN